MVVADPSLALEWAWAAPCLKSQADGRLDCSNAGVVHARGSLAVRARTRMHPHTHAHMHAE